MVADAAGVHLSTVSLALRNNERLSPATRERIQALAQKMGYTPNPLVSLLMARVRRRNTGYKGTLGFLYTVAADSSKLRGSVHRNFLVGARRRAQELGYRLDEFFMDGPESSRRLSTIFRARGISGVVIAHLTGPACPGRRLSLDLTGLAAASVGIPFAEPQLHYVANDQYMRAIIAARELLALGYRRIGLVLEGSFDTGMAHRCSAGYWAVQEYTEEVEPIPIHRQRSGDKTTLAQWLKKHRPDAVLSTSSNVLPAIRATGRQVPEDIGFAHLDWLPEHGEIAGVHGNSERTGAAAVELVVSQLHRGESGLPPRAMSHLVTGSWVPGPTLRQVGPPLELDRSFFTDLRHE